MVCPYLTDHCCAFFNTNARGAGRPKARPGAWAATCAGPLIGAKVLVGNRRPVWRQHLHAIRGAKRLCLDECLHWRPVTTNNYSLLGFLEYVKSVDTVWLLPRGNIKPLNYDVAVKSEAKSSSARGHGHCGIESHQTKRITSSTAISSPASAMTGLRIPRFI